MRTHKRRVLVVWLVILLGIVACLFVACSRKPKEEEPRPVASAGTTVSRKGLNLLNAIKAVPGPGSAENWGPSIVWVAFSHVDFQTLTNDRDLHNALLDHYENILEPEVDLKKTSSVSSVQAAYGSVDYGEYEETEPLLLYRGKFDLGWLREPTLTRHEFQGQEYWIAGRTGYLQGADCLFVTLADSQEAIHSQFTRCIEVAEQRAPSFYEVRGMSDLLRRFPDPFALSIVTFRLGLFSGLWTYFPFDLNGEKGELVLAGTAFSKTRTGVVISSVVRFGKQETASEAITGLRELYAKEGTEARGLRQDREYVHFPEVTMDLSEGADLLLMSLPDFW